jgi:glycerophosphoryl diester phosphodiesterase
MTADGGNCRPGLQPPAGDGFSAEAVSLGGTEQAGRQDASRPASAPPLMAETIGCIDRDPNRFRRVGHKGAHLIVPGNTLASFDAAIAAGVDMIEFDVLRQEHGEQLLVAHDWIDAGRPGVLTLEEGLDHLAGPAFAGVELDIDLKLGGYELRVIDALAARGLLDRSLISSQLRASLALIRSSGAGVRLGWSVPNLRRDPFRAPLLVPGAWVGLQAMRLALPSRASAAISSGAVDALMAHWRLVTPSLVSAVTRAGGELYVWTVDSLPQIQALADLGVSGVITNDPRLFAALA